MKQEELKKLGHKICFSNEAYLSIKEIVANFGDEIGWVGECERDGDTFLVTKVFIPEQKVHSTTTEISDDGIFNLMVEDKFNPDKFRYWGHSHVNMNVSPSSQDKSQMMEFAKTCDWFCGTIHNKKGDIFGYIVDHSINLYLTEVPIMYYESEDIENIMEQIRILESDLTKLRKEEKSGIDWDSKIKDRVSKLSFGFGNYKGGNIKVYDSDNYNSIKKENTIYDSTKGAHVPITSLDETSELFKRKTYPFREIEGVMHIYDLDDYKYVPWKDFKNKNKKDNKSKDKKFGLVKPKEDTVTYIKNNPPKCVNTPHLKEIWREYVDKEVEVIKVGGGYDKVKICGYSFTYSNWHLQSGMFEIEVMAELKLFMRNKALSKL